MNYFHSILDCKRKERKIFVMKCEAWTQNIVHIVNALSSVTALIIHCLKRTNIAEISMNDLYIYIQILYKRQRAYYIFSVATIEC